MEEERNYIKWDELPSEIQNIMLKYQFEQKGYTGEDRFKKYIACSDGFNWWITPEGQKFWKTIIVDKNIEAFYKVYPEKKQADMNSYIF